MPNDQLVDAPPASARRRRRTARRVAARALAATCAVIAAVPMMGLIDLGTLVGTSDPRYQWPVSLDVSWGSLFTFQLAGSYAWIALRPDRVLPAVVQLAIAAGALVVAAGGGLDTRPLWVAVPVALSALLFASLARPLPAATRTPPRVHRRYAVLAGLGVVLWLPYSLDALAVARSNPEPYITNGIDHWPVQAAAGFTLAACVLVLVVWPGAAALLRGTVALSAALIGIAMLAYPERGGATAGELWAIAVVLWAVLLALTPPSSVADPRGRSAPAAAQTPSRAD